MWLMILGLLRGALPLVTAALTQAQSNLLNAKTEQERIAAQREVATLQAQRDVLIAESKSPWNSIVRGLILAPFIVILWWILIWDKIACKWFFVERVCTTDPLSPWLAGIFAALLSFYTLRK